MSDTILKIENLSTHFTLQKKSIINKNELIIKAVNNLSVNLLRGEILGLVGESGCGKSTLGRTLLGLVKPAEGNISINSTNKSSKKMTSKKEHIFHIQMIFQDPYASLDPRLTVYDTLKEPLLYHKLETKDTIGKAVIDLMKKVELGVEYLGRYPHELSGGQRQRVAIARALSLNPDIIVADEPVSALDVSIQSQILNLLLKLQKDLNLSIIFISHDLSVVRHIANRTAVMYLGEIVEIAESVRLFSEPKHPYTKALLSALPEADPLIEKTKERILLQGEPPSPASPPGGCPFHPRCVESIDICHSLKPEKKECFGTTIMCHLSMHS